MQEREAVCENCGTVLAVPDGEAVVVCPVCGLQHSGDLIHSAPLLTSDSFESQLGALISQAHRDGLPPDEIVRVLRDELEFTAELAHSGRQFLVQLVDLGPLETRGAPQPQRDGGTTLRSRSVGN